MHVSSLNLEWLKVLPYNKNGDYDSYLSENYMGLARICKWIYLHINLITKIVEENYEFPDNGLDIKERTVKELQKWLISRHVSVGSRDGQRYLKPKLVDLVTTIQGDIENINEYIDDDTILLNKSDIEDIIITMSSFLSRLMSSKKSNVNKKEELLLNIKILLSQFNNIDMKLKKK